MHIVQRWATGYATLQGQLLSVIGGEAAGGIQGAVPGTPVTEAVPRAKRLLLHDNPFALKALESLTSSKAKGLLFQACKYGNGRECGRGSVSSLGPSLQDQIAVNNPAV